MSDRKIKPYTYYIPKFFLEKYDEPYTFAALNKLFFCGLVFDETVKQIKTGL